ncbi:MAG: alpha/beta fold hydrolase [Parvibaculaceae bacterium]
MLFMRTSDGLDLQYRESGRGPAVLFSHEFGGSHASWDKQVERLSTAHRCIVYTARGFRPSTISDDAMRYGRQEAARDIVELAEHLQLERFHLVGAGMGAVTTLLAAALLGDKVKTVTLLGCLAGPLSRLDSFDHHSRIRRALLALAQDDRTAAHAALCGQQHYERLIREKAAWWHRYRSVWEQHSATGLALTLERVEWDIPDVNGLARRLKRIEAPVLLVAGSEEHPAVHSTNACLSRILPSARLVKLPNCGGLAHVEQPAVFNKLLWQHVRNFELRENGHKHYSKLELSLNLEAS